MKNVMWYRWIVLFFVGVMQLWAAEDPRLEVRGAASVSAYETGKAFDIALLGEITEGWHGYYRNPATVGEAMVASLEAPQGFEVQGPYWQMPLREEGMLGVAYAYTHPVVVWRVTPLEDAPEHAEFVLRAAAQMCNDEGCMPASPVEARVELAQGEAASDPAWQAYEKQVETLGDTALQDVQARPADGGVVLSFRYNGPAPESAYFFSDDNTVAPDATQTLTQVGEGVYELALPAYDGSNMMYPAPKGDLSRLAGNLTFGDGAHARIDVPVAQPAAAAAAAPAGAEAAPKTGIPDGLWEAMLGVFLGGLLLNLMPCVFPVLGLKIMSFVSLGGSSRARVATHSLSFVAGILVSFWLLGILLVAVSNGKALMEAPWHEWLGILWGDAGAGDRNWAAWMENEWVVYGILLMLLVLGMWMFGIFELGARATGVGGELQNKGGYLGSFFQGFFVTIVATPCSAPYLAAALPTVMSFPAVWMLVALTAMAIGLALPYLVLGLFPSLLRCLPKPGAWMESLKQGLSFLLFAAAAWMLRVYLAFVISGGRNDQILEILVSLVVFCAAFWVYGRWCPLYRSRTSRWSGLAVALVLAGVGIAYSMPRASGHRWVEWSPTAMARTLEAGKPVYVDFTAEWCVTCQSNKRTAYTEAVYRAFADRGVVLMRADKTLPNPDIDAEMHRLHRSAVPTNVLYLPGGADPAITRALLTEGYMLDFLNEHLPSGKTAGN